VDGENGEHVGEERDRHACAGEAGASNYIYYVRKVGLQICDAGCLMLEKGYSSID